MITRQFRIAGIMLLVSVTLAGASSGKAANSGSFTDPTGDGGVDVTAVSVSSDDSGLITFAFTIPASVRLGFNSFLTVDVDADRNDSTGGTKRGIAGIDYTIAVGIGQGLNRWNGSGFERVLNHSITRTGNSSITVPRADLGNTRGFEFAGFSFGFGSSGGDDLFPNSGVWTYDLQLRAGDLSAGFAPAAPRAGKLFRVTDAQLSLQVQGGETVDATTLSCQAKLGAKALPAAGSCAWKLPKNSKGKRLTLTLTASAPGVAPFTKTVALKVR